MSDAAVTILVAGAVNIVGMVVGFLTLWVKLQHAATAAATAVEKAVVVERKLDANTVTTNLVDAKTDTIVEQTNGSLDQTRMLVASIAERVGKLEDYNRDSSHRILDGLHAVNVKVSEMVALQPKPVSVRTTGAAEGGAK